MRNYFEYFEGMFGRVVTTQSFTAFPAEPRKRDQVSTALQGPPVAQKAKILWRRSKRFKGNLVFQTFVNALITKERGRRRNEGLCFELREIDVLLNKTTTSRWPEPVKTAPTDTNGKYARLTLESEVGADLVSGLFASKVGGVDGNTELGLDAGARR